MKPFTKIRDFFPVPFWVYFLSILAGSTGLLPHQSPVYDATTKHLLPMALFLMLIGTPLTELLAMGRPAMKAMIIATTTIFFAQIVAYLVLFPYLPEESWKAVGALMGTWIGGSANMVAVKEILQMPDGLLSALVIVDTVLSYSWMALLLSGTSFQKRFDRTDTTQIHSETNSQLDKSVPQKWPHKIPRMIGTLLIGFLFAEISVAIGSMLGKAFSLLPVSGWTLLTATTLALIFALTQLQKLKNWGSPQMGTLMLYLVLVSIGLKTTLTATLQAPIFLVYGVIALLLHGLLSLLLGRYFRIPLFLLSTASQANIGGAVSAPIVAESYRAGTAHMGVLMAVFGAVLGTYLGVAGGILCRTLTLWLR